MASRLWRRRDHGPEDESFDVLLQLTLPIVLILAFLAVVEVQRLRKDNDTMQGNLKGTETGRLRQELEQAILALQRQLLAKAAEEVTRSMERDIGLASYAPAVPAPDAIVNRRISGPFVEISRTVHERLNDPDKTLREVLRPAGLRRYRELASGMPSLADVVIDSDNDKFFKAQLSGQLEQVVRHAIATQTELALAWVNDRTATQAIIGESTVMWDRVIGARDVSARDTAIKEFTRAKVLKLRQHLREAGAPLLDATLRGIL